MATIEKRASMKNGADRMRSFEATFQLEEAWITMLKLKTIDVIYHY
jgi:hypothetical protein